MKTIKENVINKIMINKSEFIACVFKIDDESSVKGILEDLKRQYKGANHYCYAYIIGDIKRSNDDGEPNGTAGNPILNILESKNLNNILCVVVRYFGGIKLGAGGLIRAYSKAVKEAIDISELISLKKGKRIVITFAYEKSKIIDNLLKRFKITERSFDYNITYNVLITDDRYLDIKKELDNLTIDIEEKEKILIEE